MAEQFRSLSSLLLGSGEAVASSDAAPLPSVEPEVAERQEPRPAVSDPRVVDLLDDFVVELTRLTARAAERLEEQAEALLADLAARVLGRELRSAPAEIDVLLSRMLAEFALAEPLVLRVSSADALRLQSAWPVKIDATLTAGDFAVDVDDGTYDLRFETRLAAMLASHRVFL